MQLRSPGPSRASAAAATAWAPGQRRRPRADDRLIDRQYRVDVSQATPPPIEPPTPSAEQLEQWRALVERIRQGDRSAVDSWDAVAAQLGCGPGRAETVATYQVLVTQRVRQQLRDAPLLLVGSVAGVSAVLRVDPTEPSMIVRLWRIGDAVWAVTFGAARGVLIYWVTEAERIVVLLDLTWAR
jgi:hypothetical protein